MASNVEQDVMRHDFVSADGHRSCVFCPNTETLAIPADAPVVLFYPAMGTQASYYRRVLRPMGESGVRFCVLEQRGQGESSIRPSPTVNFGYKELVEFDLREAVALMKKEYPAASKYLLCGHSLGGQLSVLFTAAFPGEVDGLFLVCSVSAFSKVYSTRNMRFTIRLAGMLFPVIAWAKGFHPGKSVGFGGLEAKGVIEDWSRQARTGLYLPNGSKIDYEAKLPQVKIPVFGVVVKGDDRAPLRALKHLIGKIYTDDDLVEENVEELTLPKEVMKAPHFAWVKKPGPVIERLQAFISRL